MITSNLWLCGSVDDKYRAWCVSWWCISGDCSSGPLGAFFPERPYRHVETYAKSSNRKGGSGISRAPELSDVRNVANSVLVERSLDSHTAACSCLLCASAGCIGWARVYYPSPRLLVLLLFHSRIYRVYFFSIVSRESHLSLFLLWRLLTIKHLFSPRYSYLLPLILGPLRIERLRGMDCSGNTPLHHDRSSCFPCSNSYGHPRDRFCPVYYQFCISIVSSLSIPVYQLFVLLLSNFPFWLTLILNKTGYAHWILYTISDIIMHQKCYTLNDHLCF